MADTTNPAWGGRFASAPSDLMNAFSESQQYDRKLYKMDIAGSMAHARMLARQGIISGEDARAIIEGLHKVQAEIESGQFQWQSELEDVHMNIEARLTEIIGAPGKKLHTARSRNDQVGTDFRMYVAQCLENWIGLCEKLCLTFCDLAEDNINVVLPGYTHMQPAQPVSLGQHFMAYAGMFKRDILRMRDCLPRVLISPLGACALAGSTYPIDPEATARELGFKAIYENSMDAVSDRDFALEAQFVASVIMMHVSRLAEEMIIWSSPAFGYVSLPDAFSSGSSIMPQKKNPDVPELARGKCGRVYGNLIAALTLMKGLPLTYNRDLQEDKEGFFDTDQTIRSCLEILIAMLPALKFNKDRMRAACKQGFLNATELADYLAGKNIPFREAHHLTGQAVRLAESLGKGLEDLTLKEFQSIHPAIEADIYKILPYDVCVARRESPGGTGPISLHRQIDRFKNWLKTFRGD